MKTVTRFTADDGTEFDTREACEAHEAEAVTKQLVGLSLEQLVAGIERKDISLAAALEEIGARCNRRRLADGDVRRRVKAEPAAEAAEPKAGGRKRAGAAS